MDNTKLPSSCSESEEIQSLFNDCEGDKVCTYEDSVQMECQMNIERSTGKRPRPPSNETDGDDNDGFITVQRKPKRIFRTASKGSIEEKIYEVCLSSKSCLPKQVGLAKLLKSLGIQNIMKINSKGPYRAFITFGSKEDAEKLIKCEKLIEMGYKCQFTSEVSLVFGVIREVDLDIDEKELLNEISCEQEIVSVRRLKRLNELREWIDSETVRIGFKSPIVPTYVSVFGASFKVDSYTFLVSQCSGCWKYGHSIKFCPTKKIKCPKCGKDHVNCETTDFFCINCKGAHMALDKCCPMFIKEKKIRDIMCHDNVTYKKAVEIYLCTMKTSKESDVVQNIVEKELRHSNIPPNIGVVGKNEGQNITLNKSYRDVLVSKAYVIHDNNKVTDSCSDSEIEINGAKTCKKPNTNKNKKKQRQGIDELANIMQEHSYAGNSGNTVQVEENEYKKDQRQNKTKEKQLWFRELFQRLKEIIFSKSSIEEKIFSMLKVVVEKISSFVMNMFTEGDLIQRMFSGLYNG